MLEYRQAARRSGLKTDRPTGPAWQRCELRRHRVELGFGVGLADCEDPARGGARDIESDVSMPDPTPSCRRPGLSTELRHFRVPRCLG